jgi:hypothetical protein
MVYPSARDRDNNDTVDIRNIKKMIEWDRDFFNFWSEFMRKYNGKGLEELE